MTSYSFGITWDYRCPFARNAHEHVVAALDAGAPWSVEFIPFSLSQVHVPEDGVAVWDNPDARPGLLAPEAAVVVRERFPEAFNAMHIALFAARHDQGADLREPEVIRQVLSEAGVPADKVFQEIEQEWPLLQLQKEHDAAVNDYSVFGVPTFILDGRAAFVRLMDRPQGDAEGARSSIEHVLDLILERPNLNEFKHTSVAR